MQKNEKITLIIKTLIHSLPVAAIFYQRWSLVVILLLMAALPYIKTRKLASRGQDPGKDCFWKKLTFDHIFNIL